MTKKLFKAKCIDCNKLLGEDYAYKEETENGILYVICGGCSE